MKEARCIYGLDTLTATVSVENKASQRVLEKAKFTLVERLSAYSHVADQHLECLVYQCALRENIECP